MEDRNYPLINEKIEARRLELGLSDVEVARQVRLSIYEYGDIEYYADEIFTVIPLYHVKKLCSILQIDFFTLFEKSCVFCEEDATHIDDNFLRRDLLIHKKREALGFSIEELGDRLGFYGAEINLIETYTAHLESWVIENIFELSTLLQIPYQVLLDIQCSKCGR